MWKVQRKAGMAFLNTKNLQVLTDVALPQYLSQSIDYLEAAAEGCREVDLQAVFHEITTQLMGKMAYNVRPLCFPTSLRPAGFSDTLSRWTCTPMTTLLSPSTMPPE